jgi:NAD-dependent deacetylase
MVSAMSAEEALLDALRSAAGKNLVVITGAGISLASGLPTFRGSDPDAIWERDVTEIGTIAFFRRDPVVWWRWFDLRFGSIQDAEPNPAHEAIVALERAHLATGGRFLLITQNVDLLHERAGSKRIAKIHGTSDRVRCSREGCRFGAPAGSIALAEVDFSRFRAEPSLANIPRCPQCRELIRAHALLFDELYTDHFDYRFDQARSAIGGADLMVFVGTSFSVGITELALWAGRARGTPMLSVDPIAAAPPGVVAIREAAEQVLPRIVGMMA